jgi:hypothetical protein
MKTLNTVVLVLVLVAFGATATGCGTAWSSTMRQGVSTTGEAPWFESPNPAQEMRPGYHSVKRVVVQTPSGPVTTEMTDDYVSPEPGLSPGAQAGIGVGIAIGVAGIVLMGLGFGGVFDGGTTGTIK